jgi:3-(methylthio)propionyl---CoA ligase
MQEHDLLVSSVIRHAATNHGDREIVSREPHGRLHRTNYRDVERRSRRLAAGLTSIGIRQGDRIATLAMNHFRHLECFYGVSGMGAVLHTVNPRLFPDQIAFILNHAESRVVLLDPAFVPMLERLASELSSVETLIVLAEPDLVPDCASFSVLSYEDLIESSPDDYEWPVFDESTASSLCYTSGTTGGPKGVLYSHRSTLLHALATLQADWFGLRSVDVVLPVVPMFHVHAWSTPYGCAMSGAKLVLPGSQLDPASLVELIQSEAVTFALGVPTVWSSLIGHLRAKNQSVPTLQRAVIGGSAMPPAIHRELEEAYGVRAMHAWGMTEVSPIGTVATTTAALEAASAAERAGVLLKQGRPAWGVELKVTDADGEMLPRDGTSSGPLWVRGHWVARRYFRREEEELLDADGWFPTGDVATLDGQGFMRITDRNKDVIKSGGEWISSIDIENIAMLHPAVRFAAAVGAHHPKWGERPVLIVVAAERQAPTPEDLLEFLRPRMAKWWLPDAVVFVRELPLTATGKVLKAKLRADYRYYLFQAEPESGCSSP